MFKLVTIYCDILLGNIMDPVSAIGAALTLLSAASKLYNIALKLRDAKERKKNFMSVRQEGDKMRRPQEQTSFITLLDKPFLRGLFDIEFSLVGTVAEVADEVVSYNVRLEITVEMLLIISTTNSEYVRTSRAKSFRIFSDMKKTHVTNNIIQLINDVRNLKAESERIKKGEGNNRPVFVNIVSYRRNNGPESEETPKDIKAFMLMLGDVITTCLTESYDHRFIKSGKGDNTKVSYRKNSNLLVEAVWRPPSGGGAGELLVNMRNIVKQSGCSETTKANLEKIGEDDGQRNIILIGQSGSGKSRTANLICSALQGGVPCNVFRESRNGACTYAMQCLKIDEEGTNGVPFCVWDTPGLLDKHNRDIIFVDRIADAADEMGKVSVVVLCLTELSRTDVGWCDMMKSYAKAISTRLHSRLIIVVNRQMERIDNDNADTIMEDMREAGFSNISRFTCKIFDLSSSTTDVDRNKESESNSIEFMRTIYDMCEMSAIRLGLYEQILSGLDKLLKDINNTNKKELIDQLKNRSEYALRKAIEDVHGEEPKMTKCLTNKIWIERKKSDNNNLRELCTYRWSLKVVDKTNLLARARHDVMSSFAYMVSGKPLEEAFKILRHRDLIFVRADGGEEKITTKLNGDVVVTSNYRLLNLEDGTEADLKARIEELTQLKTDHNNQNDNNYED